MYCVVAAYVYQNKTRSERVLGIFCLLVFLPQRADQAANAYELSFAVTCFARITFFACRAVHSVTLCPVEAMTGPS